MFSYANFALTEIGLTYESTNQNHFMVYSSLNDMLCEIPCYAEQVCLSSLASRDTARPIAIAIPCYKVLEIVNSTLLKTKEKQIDDNAYGTGKHEMKSTTKIKIKLRVQPVAHTLSGYMLMTEPEPERPPCLRRWCAEFCTCLWCDGR